MKARPKTPMTIDVKDSTPNSGVRSFTVTVAPGVELPNLDPRTWSHGQPMPPSNPSMSIAARPPAQRLEGFRMVWPESQVVNNEGRTSLDDLRSNPTTPEVPQFGFNTNFHFDQFPILHGALDAPQPVGGPNVATVPPGNHPYAAFSDDSPWQITYDGVLYLEQILRCPTHGSRLTNYGLFLDTRVHLPAGQVIHERVLLLGVPDSFNDPRVTLVYSTVWHLMLASLADLRHSSVTDRMARLRQWCLLSHDLYTLSVQRNFAGPSKFRRDIAAAIFECTASMLAPNMRTWFAQHNDMQAILSAEPPNCFFRRRV